jgi:hypothetical protein
MIESKSIKERFFSIELKSKANLKNVSLTNGQHDSAVIEGTIGELQSCSFAEEVVFEVVGTKGVLRVDLHENEIRLSRKGGDNQ